MICKRKEKQKKEEEQLNYPKEKKSTLKTLFLGNAGTRGHLYAKGGTRGRIRGHTSKLDSWPHQKSCFRGPSRAVSVAPGCEAFCCTSLLIPPVALSESAPRISR